MGVLWCKVDPLLHVANGDERKRFHLRLDVIKADSPDEEPSTLLILHNPEESVEVAGRVPPAMFNVNIETETDGDVVEGELEFQLEWAEHRKGQLAHFTLFEVGPDDADVMLKETVPLEVLDDDNKGLFVWAAACWN